MVSFTDAPKNLKVEDLYSDFEDSKILNQLCAISNGGNLERENQSLNFLFQKKNYKRPTMKIKKLEAIGMGIRFMKAAGLRVTVEPKYFSRICLTIAKI